MASLKFKLRGNSIQLIFSYGRKKLFRPVTGFSVKKVQHWDVKRQRVKDVKDEPNAFDINNSLEKLKNNFLNLFNKLLTEGVVIDNSILAEEFRELGNNASAVQKKKTNTFSELFETWIKHNETRRINGKLLGKGTINTYKNTLSVFKNYESECGQIHFRNININFYNSFLSYCEKPKTKKVGYSRNTIGKYIKNLNTFLKYAKKHHEVELPKSYYADDFKVTTEDVQEIYLTNKELMKMYHLNLSGVEDKYSQARDIFLIGAYTGLRVSDYNSLVNDDFIKMKGKKFLKLKIRKTQTEQIIPVFGIVNEIIERRGGLPQKMPEQKINKYIKEVGEFAGIDETVLLSRTQGGITRRERKMKFDLIKSHTARRSFCTNAYIGGTDVLTIMSLSGHKSERSFLKYIKITPEERAKNTAEMEYFENLSSKKYDAEGNLIIKEII